MSSRRNPTRTFRALIPVTFAAGLTALALLSFAPAVHAGPTAAVDLDLGTSVGMGVIQNPPVLPPQAAQPYVVGFRVRAGWRFDIGPFWILPEIGGGYDVERVVLVVEETRTVGSSLPRVFAGARAGLSFPLAPAVRLEPALYGHVGYAYYEGGPGALANDVGLALDVRFLERFMLGAHVGYEVVTQWVPGLVSLPPGPTTGKCGPGFGSPQSCPLPTPMGEQVSIASGDKWIGYGVHFGVVF
jgi:hypothetical protein